MTSPVVQETSPALLPVDRDPFLDDGTAAPIAQPAPEPTGRRRIFD